MSFLSFLFVASERVGQRAWQRTLLNLGRWFDLPQIDWSLLCTCLDSVRTTGLCRQRWASSTDCRENPLQCQSGNVEVGHLLRLGQ